MDGISSGGAAPAASPSPTSTASPAQGSQTQSTTPQSGQLTTGSTPKAPDTSQSSTEMYDVKVNGKTVRMTRQELIDNASMVHAANERFNEAARIRKEYEEKQSKYQKSPIDAFLDYAKNLPPEQRRQAIEDYYVREYIEPETLTAEQKQLRELQAFKKQKEEEEALRLEKDKREQEEKLTTQEREFLQSQIIEAMEASGLPKTKFFVSRMAFYMRQNLVNGWQAPIQMIVKQVQKERQEMMSDLSSGATAEQLIGLFGDDIINKIRAHDLKKLRESRQALGQTPQTRAGTGPISTTEKISSSEVNKRLRDMRTGKFVPSS